MALLSNHVNISIIWRAGISQKYSARFRVKGLIQAEGRYLSGLPAAPYPASIAILPLHMIPDQSFAPFLANLIIMLLRTQ